MRFLPLILILLIPACGQRGADDKDSQIVKTPSVEQFKKLIANNPVVLVDFQATWCGPCKMMKPIVQDLERDYRGRLLVVEVDVDERPELADEYGISSLPTFLMFRGGKAGERILGAPPRIDLVRLIETSLK